MDRQVATAAAEVAVDGAQRAVGRGDLADAAALGGLGRPGRHPGPAPALGWLAGDLPPEPVDFVGRTAELGRVLTLVPAGARAPVALPAELAGPAAATAVCVLSGPAGTGKTAFAVYAAHRLADCFPDGVAFVDLAPERGEAGVGGVAGRRMLIVLDDAVTAEQVTPLIPASPGSLVLVTSRRPMPSVCAAHPLRLAELPVADGLALFSRVARLGPVAAGAVEQIVDLCAGSPLAIRLVAAVLRAHPGRADDLAARLCAAMLPAAGLDDTERGLAAAFILAYHALDPDPRRLLRLLGGTPPHDISAGTAAALLDAPPSTATRALRRLHAARLLDPDRTNRYRLPAAIRWYAAHLCTVVDPGPARRAATTRLEAARRTAAQITRLPIHPRARGSG
jgi:NB-ARC domain